MSENFKPIAERSRWRMIYDLFRQAEIGQTITYETMGKALGLHPINDRHALQMAARRAGLEIEKVDKRAADAVRNTGYRIVEPSEILGLGKRRNRKAGKQIQRGAITVAATDLNSVDRETRNALETLARGFAVQAEVNRRFAAKQQRHDELFELLLPTVDRIAQRVERLEGQYSDPSNTQNS